MFTGMDAELIYTRRRSRQPKGHRTRLVIQAFDSDVGPPIAEGETIGEMRDDAIYATGPLELRGLRPGVPRKFLAIVPELDLGTFLRIEEGAGEIAAGGQTLTVNFGSGPLLRFNRDRSTTRAQGDRDGQRH